MRAIVAGSRSIRGEEGKREVIKAMKNSTWHINEIISGGAHGVDTLAIEIAKEYHIDYVVFPANWKKYGKAAGFKGNQKMAWYASLFNDSHDAKDKLKGCLIAIWDGKSSGTKHMIEIAEKNSLPTYVHLVDKNK